jgi:3'5'-cyclic nucleotide phosphodiesterase
MQRCACQAGGARSPLQVYLRKGACLPRWAERVLEEFFAQGDTERRRGMPQSPMMDRHATSPAMSQIGFMEFIVAPMFHQAGLRV